MASNFGEQKKKSGYEFLLFAAAAVLVIIIATWFGYILEDTATKNGIQWLDALNSISDYADPVAFIKAFGAVFTGTGIAKKGMVLGFVCGMLIILWKFAGSGKRYHRRGTEHGSARWGNRQEKDIIADTNDFYNNVIAASDVVNFKTTSKSYKNRKRLMRPLEERVIFKDVNEPIISREDWEEVQAIYEKKKRVPIKRDPDIFQSYLFCADCGHKMYIRYKNDSPVRYYLCSGYAKRTSDCTTHHIKQDVLIDLVLKSIRNIVSRANLDKAEFAKELNKKADNKFDREYKHTVKENEKMKSRRDNLDKIIKQLFEDRALGKISDERYFAMAEGYEKEQAEIDSKLAEYQAKIDERNTTRKGVDYFIKLVDKYSEINELTPQILSEFIDKIVIHQAEKDENGTSQTVDIYYKGVGVLN